MHAGRERFERIEHLFHQMLALPPDQRMEALDLACAGQAEIRREVESLLRHAEGGPADLEWTEALRTAPLDGAPDPNLHRRIGLYEIQRKLGAGGMGNVYLAVQTEPVRRSVALKLIKRGLDTDETIRRFENERQVLATLNHPNISQLFDGGATTDGLPYFVMEYVEGEPITAYCDRRRLTIRQRLEVFRQVCAAVHFAHQNTVLHRDLKPANILVTADGVPKLLDFGLAKLSLPGPGPHTQTYTLPEYRPLTPDYASPEQILGQKITTASDVYSLGMILYELLAGRRPYDLGGRSRTEIDRIISADVLLPRPSEMVRRHDATGEDDGRPNSEMIGAARGVHPAQLCRQLRGDLDNIVLMALRREPQLRYGSVEQFLADIDRHLNHQPVVAAPPSSLYRLRKFARRHRVACVLIAAMAFGLIGSITGAVVAMRSRDAARAAEAVARDQAKRLRRETYAKQIALATSDLQDNLASETKQRLDEAEQDLRDWEWHFLSSLTDESRLSLKGHGGAVATLSYSPDGRWLASGGLDGTIRIWNVGTGEQLRLLSSPSGGVNSMAFSPEGRQLIAGNVGGVLMAWDVSTWTPAWELNVGCGSICSVRLSPDGRWVATGTQDGRVRLWDAATRGLVRTMEGYDGQNDSLAFSAGGDLLAAGGTEIPVRLWETATGAVKPAPKAFEGPVVSIAFSPDGRTMAVAARRQPIRFVDTKTWSRFRATSREQMSDCSVVFTPDSRTIICAANIGYRVRVTDVDSRRALRNYRGHDDKVQAVAVSPDGRSIASTGRDGVIKVWDSNPVWSNPGVETEQSPISCVSFCPDGRFLAVGNDKGVVEAWDTVRRVSFRQFAVHNGPVASLAFSADGRIFASAGMDGEIRIWDAVTGDQVQRFRAHAGGVASLAFVPKGHQLVSGGADDQVKVWDADAGRQLGAMTGHRGSVGSVTVSPDGKWVISGGNDGVIRVWEANTRTCLRELSGHDGPIQCVAVSLVAERLVSAGADRTLRIWDYASGRQLRVVMKEEVIYSVAFNPGGSRFVSVSGERGGTIWDPEIGIETLSMSEHALAPTCAAFSPDGSLLVTGGKDARIIMRDTRPYSAVVLERLKQDQLLVEAGKAVMDLRNRLGIWQDVAAAVHSDRTMPEPVRHEALKLILRRSVGPDLPAADWDVAFFSWPPTEDVQELDARWRAASEGPNVVRTVRKVIDFNWDNCVPVQGMPLFHFGFIARASPFLAAGRYLVDTTSDDGLRVWIDGQKVIEDWTRHSQTRRATEIDLAEGNHSIRIEYFQMGGGARIRVSLSPITPTSTSSHAAD